MNSLSRTDRDRPRIRELLRIADLDCPDSPDAGLSRWRASADVRRLAPLLWRKQLSHPGSLAMNDIAWLRELATEAIVEQQIARRWLRDLEQRLSSAGLHVLLLKGAAFNGWLYADEAPRRGVDIDLLAPADTFTAVEGLLLESHEAVLIDARRRLTHRQLFERVYRPRTLPGMVVELHRDLTNPGLYRIDHSALWWNSRAHPAHPGGALRIPSTEHALLNLALHAARNRRFDDYGLLDARRLIRAAEPAWERLYREATAWGAKTALHLLLRGVEDCWPEDAPLPITDTLRPGRARRRLLRRLSATKAGGRLAQLAWQYALSDHAGGVLRFQLGYLATRIGDRLDAALQPYRPGWK